jgi:hypothetical protein
MRDRICLPFAEPGSPWFLVGSILLIFLVLCAMFFALFVFILCPEYPILSVTLHCPILIFHSVFSNVYLLKICVCLLVNLF